MTYKLKPQLSLIKSPVILVVDGKEQSYSDGTELLNLIFEKRYVVESITARENMVVVILTENDQILNINWSGEEAVSFM